MGTWETKIEPTEQFTSHLQVVIMTKLSFFLFIAMLEMICVTRVTGKRPYDPWFNQLARERNIEENAAQGFGSEENYLGEVNDVHHHIVKGDLDKAVKINGRIASIFPKYGKSPNYIFKIWIDVTDKEGIFKGFDVRVMELAKDNSRNLTVLDYYVADGRRKSLK